MRGAIKALIVASAVAVASAPAVARADGYVSPWVAANAGQNVSNLDNGTAGFGVNAGAMGAGIVGGELDFGWTPNYFGRSSVLGTNNVIDLMGNVIVGVPIGGTYGAGVRPFVTAGLGLIRTSIAGNGLIGPGAIPEGSNNMFGWNAGAGVMGFFNDHVGLRGDVRYLRGFENQINGATDIDFTGTGQFHTWRAAVGVVLR